MIHIIQYNNVENVGWLDIKSNGGDNMKIDIHIAKGSKLVNVGYIDIPAFDADRCWELCNWKHWLKIKPQNLHSDIYSCNHGICFTNPETKEMWLA